MLKLLGLLNSSGVESTSIEYLCSREPDVWFWEWRAKAIRASV